jgi:dihydrodipicolinate synthase/N-acetylneuraminate lyase
VPVIAGAGSNDTQRAIALSRESKAAAQHTCCTSRRCTTSRPNAR